MANHCYNYVSFQGENKALRELQKKLDKYDECKYFQEFGNYVLGLAEVGDETWKTDEKQHYYDYGTKWWDFEIQERDFHYDTDMYVSGDSAWSPPVELVAQICIKYKLTAEMEYEEGGVDFAGIVEFNHEGIVSHDEMTYHEYRYKDDVGSWIDNLSFNYEGADKEEWENLLEEHPYAKESHIKELVEAIEKINS